MALTDLDLKYWPNLKQGESLYVHKLAVKRAFAGKSISKELIDFAKELVVKRESQTLRLDCNWNRNELRRVYEKQGFICVGRFHAEVYQNDMALYAWKHSICE